MLAAKADLRREAQSVRSALHLKGDEGDAAAAHFMAQVAPKPGQVVAAYWPIKRELDTLPLLEQLATSGARVVLPVVTKSSDTLLFRAWTPDQDLGAGAFGIPVPPDTAELLVPDIVVIPLLAFDRRGTRLGYGGGYYDRTLALLQGQQLVQVIGYAYAEQMCLFPLPREGHDIPMDMVITPQGVHRF